MLKHKSNVSLRSFFQRCIPDFSEFVENETSRLNHHINLKNAKAFSFSVRNQFNELDVILCYGPMVRRDFCYWIIIGAWHNSKSAIRKCPEGIPIKGDKRQTECDKLVITFDVRHDTLFFWNIPFQHYPMLTIDTHGLDNLEKRFRYNHKIIGHNLQES